MKPLLRVLLIVNALIFLAFGLLFVLTPWAGIYGALRFDSIHVQPAFAGQLLGIALVGLSWLAFHAAIDGALTARAAKVSGQCSGSAAWSCWSGCSGCMCPMSIS